MEDIDIHNCMEEVRALAYAVEEDVALGDFEMAMYGCEDIGKWAAMLKSQLEDLED